MWGKGSYEKLKFNELRNYSRPKEICQKVKMNQVSVGLEHCLLVDSKGHLWALGANSKGNLASGDTKKKPIPCKVQLFQNKRVIDVACGDRFSIIIAEVYELQQDQEQKYFE